MKTCLLGLAVVGWSLALVHPATAIIFLFLPTLWISFFLGTRAGLTVLLPTLGIYFTLTQSWLDALLFLGLCLFGVVIAGITTCRYRQTRCQELRLLGALDLAREVQRTMEPTPVTSCDGLEVATFMEVCQQLGGDFVCLRALGPDAEGGRLLVLLGDVLGKGAPAALMAAYAKGAFDVLSRDIRSPREMVEKLHGLLSERSDDGVLFISMVCLEADTGQRLWKVCRGGQTPPLLLRRQGRVEVLNFSGIVVGAGLPAEFEEGQVAMLSGDLLLMASDGLLEELEMPPDILPMLESGRNGPLQPTLQAIVARLEQDRAGFPPDDRTAVLLRYTHDDPV